MPRLAPVTRAVRPESFIGVLFRGQCFGRSHVAALGGWGNSGRARTCMCPRSAPFSLHLMINIPTRRRLQAPPRLSASQPTDHVPELFRSEGKLAAPVGMRADRSLVHTPMHAEFVPHAVQMRLALDRVGTEV